MASAEAEGCLGPLSFPEMEEGEAKQRLTPCLLCDEKFSVDDESSRQFFLRHLFSAHHVVIGDVEEICDLSLYCTYWKGRLRRDALPTYMSVIETNTKPMTFPGRPKEQQPASERFFLLSHALPEDAALRKQLQLERLRSVLAVQERERMDKSFQRQCLFCSQVVTGNRSDLFTHMLTSHRFSIGNPDNLVFVGELLDVLRQNLDANQCLFCEKLFRDRQTLKDHIRKKQHRKINPKNKAYDRFYIINYLELGKNWEEMQGEEELGDENDEEDEEEEDAEESPLKSYSATTTGDGTSVEEHLETPAVCLFCKVMSCTVHGCYEHMLSEHQFSLQLALLRLSFYDRVKVINYVRRCVVKNICISCETVLHDNKELLSHMAEQKHFAIPDPSVWKDAAYLFPTYDNDALLMELDEDLDGAAVVDDGVALPEILPPAEEEVLELVRKTSISEKS